MRHDIILTGPIAPATLAVVEERVVSALPAGGSWCLSPSGADRSYTWQDGRQVTVFPGLDKAELTVGVGSWSMDADHNRWAAEVFEAVAAALPGVHVELLDEDDKAVRTRRPGSAAA